MTQHHKSKPAPTAGQYADPNGDNMSVADFTSFCAELEEAGYETGAGKDGVVQSWSMTGGNPPHTINQRDPDGDLPTADYVKQSSGNDQVPVSIWFDFLPDSGQKSAVVNAAAVKRDFDAMDDEEFFKHYFPTQDWDGFQANRANFQDNEGNRA